MVLKIVKTHKLKQTDIWQFVGIELLCGAPVQYHHRLESKKIIPIKLKGWLSSYSLLSDKPWQQLGLTLTVQLGS